MRGVKEFEPIKNKQINKEQTNKKIHGVKLGSRPQQLDSIPYLLHYDAVIRNRNLFKLAQVNKRGDGLL